ncbi:FAP50 [Symbiodinium sp. CCMP2456]|nr:FAP50 [Symbiodinium sp. CCMP2456]
MRLQEAFPDGKDALPGLFSARFDGGPTEHKFRRVYEILKAHNFPVLMVAAKCGDDFGRLTTRYLSQIEENHGKLICVCTAHYAEITSSPFSSFHELKYAYDYKLDVLPLKVEDVYPPRPPSGKDHPHDQDGEAKALIKMVFRPNKAFTDVRDLDETEIARVIADCLLKPTGTLAMTSKALDMDEKKVAFGAARRLATPPPALCS